MLARSWCSAWPSALLLFVIKLCAQLIISLVCSTHMSDVAVKCSCGLDAGKHCLKEPKLCGHCCWPRCVEGSHGSGRRGTKRGGTGNKSAKDKRRTYRNESWMAASLIADVVQANPETMGYVRRSGYTFAQLTHKLWSLLQQPVGETSVSLELINKFPPRVLGVLEDAILARMSTTTELGRVPVAPTVWYLHESWNCQTPPAEVMLPDNFAGRLLWGGLSHGMSKDWLLYENVKLVVNCINTVSAGGEPNLLWQESVKVRGEVRKEITFIDFCVNYAGDKRQYVKKFAAICAILDRGDCVYIHCRSGKDRSPFTVFALLQLEYNIDEDTARAALATRIGCDGRCIANVDVGHEANWKRLTSQLRALGRPVTGV